jgi:ribosomal protein S1
LIEAERMNKALKAGRVPSLVVSVLQSIEDAGLGERFTVGQTVNGEVTRLAQFGAFVELSPGIEGLIHISEMSAKRRIHQVGEVVQPKDKVTVQIVSVDPIQRRIGLSLKALQEGDVMAESDTKSQSRRDSEDEGRGVEFRAPEGGANAFAAAFQQAIDKGGKKR